MGRRKLRMMVTHIDCSNAVTAGMAVRGLTDLVVSMHAPELCRAVRDTAGALAEAQRVLASQLSAAEMAQRRELAEIAAMEAELARRKGALRARSEF